MAVDSNFAGLEEEVNRMVELLARLKQDKADLQGRVEALEAENSQLKEIGQRLQQVEQESLKSREEVKSRIEGLLAKLDAIHS